MTFKNWWENWYNNYIKYQLCYGTVKEYEIYYKKHYYLIENYEIEQIKAIDIMQVMNSTVNYANSRQRKVYFVLQRCFKDAVANETVEKNPMGNIKPPKKIKKKC